MLIENLIPICGFHNIKHLGRQLLNHTSYFRLLVLLLLVPEDILKRKMNVLVGNMRKVSSYCSFINICVAYI